MATNSISFGLGISSDEQESHLFFSIAPIERMPRMHDKAVHRQMNAYLDRNLIIDRAGDDALNLMQAYSYAIGKKPKVVEIK